MQFAYQAGTLSDHNFLLIIFSFLTFLNIVPHLTFLPWCTQEGAAHQKANIRCHDDRPRFHHINKVQHQTGSCPYKHAPARALFSLGRKHGLPGIPAKFQVTGHG